MCSLAVVQQRLDAAVRPLRLTFTTPPDKDDQQSTMQHTWSSEESLGLKLQQIETGAERDTWVECLLKVYASSVLCGVLWLILELM